MVKIAIIILTYNVLDEATRPCIESIYAAKNNYSFQVLVVDNNSTDGTVDYLTAMAQQKDNLSFITNNANLGYAKANNIGISSVNADYYFLLNNDTVVTDHWIDSIVDFLNVHPDIGMAGPVSNSVGNEQAIYSEGNNPDSIITEGLRWVEHSGNEFFYTEMLGFFCVAIKQEVIDSVGLLDEQFGIGTFEDDDYCMRTRAAGFKLAVLENVFILHKGSLTFQNNSVNIGDIFIENLIKFNNKHNIKWKPVNLVAAQIKIAANYMNNLIKDNDSSNGYKLINRLKYIEQNQSFDTSHEAHTSNIYLKIENKSLNEELIKNKEELRSISEDNKRLGDDNNTLNSKVSSLQSHLQECDSHIKLLTSELSMIYNSLSWKISRYVNALLGKAPFYKYIHQFVAYIKTRNVATPIQSSSVNQDIDIYTYNKLGQFRTYSEYLTAPVESEIKAVRDLIGRNSGRQIIVYPLSYELKIKQRPEHILDKFSELGYLGIILSHDPAHKGIVQLQENLYVTTLVGAVCYVLRETPIILYITYAHYGYLTRIFKKYSLIYDTLDEIHNFAGYCDDMVVDHKSLLNRADIALFSASKLFDKYCNETRHPLLIENGVNVDAFKITDVEADISKIEKTKSCVVGYVGLISELIDFKILNEIADIADVELVLIGPVHEFNVDYKEILSENVNKIKIRDNVNLVGFVEYADLKYYLKDFDICIVPFEINDVTDSVSPLKMFEYMAFSKPIVCTKTLELAKYSNYVYVEDRDSFKDRILSIIAGNQTKVDYTGVLSSNSWEALVGKIDCMLTATKLEARPEISKNIDILTFNFYDWSGTTLYKGGAERYIYDLAKLLLFKGHNVKIVQNATKYFETDYCGVKVVGIPAVLTPDASEFSSYYYNNYNHSEYTICSPLDLACKLAEFKAVVGINHGIYWDTNTNRLINHDYSKYNKLFEALRNTHTCVCVDTNFINWMRTIDYSLGEKLKYVPNYYDESQFQPVAKDFSNDEIIITYPRRLYEARGFYIALEMADTLLSKYSNIKIKFVGQVDKSEEIHILSAVGKYPGRVVWLELAMEEMEKAYTESQIVIVPTLYAEGTSLSCIEAMATNNAIVSTNIGGLPNLIIDGYNGLLINPTARELSKAVERLIVDRELRMRLAANALHLSRSFGKSSWDSRWNEIIDDYFG